ncbi:WXG100 family type VII secretion target [Saccharopolyspora mangrovi]|uniref:WXG100 family type VII secretion target n=1 Tax=Saccharopolyspora mangrovi TaxID=3082379 RepID=A0ABU6AB58_9PSEU|nr:hypothetical protein [Saccharopolyspora sp. S2-29]MEB3368769.1 hypothetical protein [Saccharopolyspora sp. S2-29]
MSAEHLHYLAGIADELDVAHSIPADAAELVGRPEDFRAAARVWREAAANVERSSGDVDGKLGGIDTAWQGADAEAFVAHIRDAGLAGKDLADSMTGLAEALEHTAEGVGAQQRRLTELVAKTADDVRSALAGSDEDRAREHLAALAEPARELLESIADYYMAFTRLCDDMAGVATREPGRWEAQPPAAAATGSAAARADEAAGTSAASASGESGEDQSGTSAAAGGVAAGAAVGAAGVGMGMMPMGMMGGMLGQRGGGNKERQNSSRFKSNPEELFGTPPDSQPAVFGEQPKPQQSEDQKAQAAPGKLDLPSTLQPAPPKPSIDQALAPEAEAKPKAEPETGTASVGDAPPPKPRG